MNWKYTTVAWLKIFVLDAPESQSIEYSPLATEKVSYLFQIYEILRFVNCWKNPN